MAVSGQDRQGSEPDPGPRSRQLLLRSVEPLNLAHDGALDNKRRSRNRNFRMVDNIFSACLPGVIFLAQEERHPNIVLNPQRAAARTEALGF